MSNLVSMHFSTQLLSLSDHLNQKNGSSMLQGVLVLAYAVSCSTEAFFLTIELVLKKTYSHISYLYSGQEVISQDELLQNQVRLQKLFKGSCYALVGVFYALSGRPTYNLEKQIYLQLYSWEKIEELPKSPQPDLPQQRVSLVQEQSPFFQEIEKLKQQQKDSLAEEKAKAQEEVDRIKRDYAAVLAEIREKAAEAKFKLSICLYYAVGVEQNIEMSMALLKEAAELGCFEAQYNLGVCYYLGDGVEKNLIEAFHLFQQTAEQGFAAAQHNLGVCYYNGEGTEKDSIKALYWFKQAAEQGFANAQYEIGKLYLEGIGTFSPNLLQAEEWFIKAALQDHREAREWLKKYTYWGEKR